MPEPALRRTALVLVCPRCGRHLPLRPRAAFCPRCIYQYAPIAPETRERIALVGAADAVLAGKARYS